MTDEPLVPAVPPSHPEYEDMKKYAPVVRVTDKRGAKDVDQEQAPESNQSSREATSVGITETGPALDPAALDGIIKRPEIGRKFYIDDVQFQIVDATLTGLLVVPVGISPQAMKKVRRLMRHGSH